MEYHSIARLPQAFHHASLIIRRYPFILLDGERDFERKVIFTRLESRELTIRVLRLPVEPGRRVDNYFLIDLCIYMKNYTAVE